MSVTRKNFYDRIREATVQDESPERSGTDSQRKAMAMFQGIMKTPSGHNGVRGISSPVKTEIGPTEVNSRAAKADDTEQMKPSDYRTPMVIKSDVTGIVDVDSLATTKALRRHLGASFSDER